MTLKLLIQDGVELKLSERVKQLKIGDLAIRNINVEDEGFYLCVLSGFSKEKYAQALLTVNGIKILKNLNNYFLS